MDREPKRDHVIREPLTKALSSAALGDIDDIVEVVLRTLSQQRLIDYAPAGDLQLLTTYGRTLVAIMEDPSITLRALAVYLGISESSTQKTVKALMDKGLVAKTKVDRASNFEVCKEMAFSHPDITRFFDAIAQQVRNARETATDIQADEAPF